jgi:hypothetical protein
VWILIRTRTLPPSSAAWPSAAAAIASVAREGYEERVALGVDLDAVVPRESVAEHPAVLGEDVRVAVTELLEQARRALDVGEEELTVPLGSCRTRT